MKYTPDYSCRFRILKMKYRNLGLKKGLIALAFMLGMTANVWATVTISGAATTCAGASPNFSGADCVVSATDIQTALASGAVSVTSTSGNVVVATPVACSANTLTLAADQNISINAVMSATGTEGITLTYADTLTMQRDDATDSFTGKINLASTSTVNINGASYTVINSLGAEGSTTGIDLQGINGNLSGKYVLGADINATATSGWNGGLGFDPIANPLVTGSFSGAFDGFGHIVSNISINRPTRDWVGLFGSLFHATQPTISNLGLKYFSITGRRTVGALAGSINNSKVYNSFIGGTSTISGDTSVANEGYGIGGLVGLIQSSSTISNSYSTANVNGLRVLGGFVGSSITGSNVIENSFSTGSVSNNIGTILSDYGGFIGYAERIAIRNCYSEGNVSSINGNVGGFVGRAQGVVTIDSSYSSGNVTGNRIVGGFVGQLSTTSTVNNSYSLGNTIGTGGSQDYFGGFLGYTNSSTATITNSYSTGTVQNTINSGGFGVRANGTISNSFWDINSSGRATSMTFGTTGKTTAEMKTKSTFTDATWDFSDIWNIDAPINDGYPCLIGMGGCVAAAPAIYTIEYDANGGTGTTASSSHTYDVAKTLNANSFTRVGYTFSGWNSLAVGGGDSYTNEHNVTNLSAVNGATVTLYAQWTINPYTITFNSDGGSAVSAITQNFGTAVTAPANPTKTGYTFSGWNPVLPVNMPASDVTHTAQWTINTYTVIFKDYDDTDIATQTITHGNDATAPASPTRSGYTFTGWSPATFSNVTANLNVTAQYDALIVVPPEEPVATEPPTHEIVDVIATSDIDATTEMDSDGNIITSVDSGGVEIKVTATSSGDVKAIHSLTVDGKETRAESELTNARTTIKADMSVETTANLYSNGAVITVTANADGNATHEVRLGTTISKATSEIKGAKTFIDREGDVQTRVEADAYTDADGCSVRAVVFTDRNGQSRSQFVKGCNGAEEIQLTVSLDTPFEAGSTIRVYEDAQEDNRLKIEVETNVTRTLHF